MHNAHTRIDGRAPVSGVQHPALRYHGGKFAAANWLLGMLPAHRVYVEPFGGAAGLLLRKPISEVEVYNDRDDEIVGFFEVLRDREKRAALCEALALTPYARREFERAYTAAPVADPVERARRVVIRAQMGFGSAGATKGRTGWRTYCGVKNPHIEWRNAPDAIRAAGERFERVIIECRDAFELIAAHDAADVLHFVDPPYVPDTRCTRASSQTYRHELDAEQHGRLVELLLSVEGAVLLCGYPTEIYAPLERAGWRREERQARASGRRGGVMRTEAVWLNPRALSSAKQMRLLA